MSELKLISVDLLYNYVEAGDKLYITATWQNEGDMPDFNAKITADIVFGECHRLEPTQCSNYSITWQPFPATNMWKNGDVWTTTGVWPVTAVWGGSHNISLSLTGEKGERIEFIGKDGVKTFSQFVTEIDIGWGWGRPRLLEQRKPLSVQINPVADVACVNLLSFEKIGGYKFNTKYPAICGFENENWYDLPSVLTVRKIEDNSVLTFVGDCGTLYSLKNDGQNGVKYTANNEFCSFEVGILENENKLSVSIDNVSERDGYELISLEIPSLVQVFNEDACLVNYFGGGRKIALNKALTQTNSFYYDACNALGAFGENGSFAVVANDVDNILRQSVVRKNKGKNVGIIGVVIRVHIKANNPLMKSIPVKLEPLDIYYNKESNWALSANILRGQLPVSYEKLYENTLLYKIRMDASGQYNPERPETYSPIVTLADVKNIIMRVFKVSNGARQVVYLVGWQKGGHDFEYPYPHLSEFNPKCGSLAEFNSLREELKRYNVELSLHDNFDDAYLSDAYKIKEEMLCKNAKDEPWKGWLWAGGMSYIISPTAYLKTDDINERINRTVSDYGIEGTYHLDVLSSEVRRYSFAQNELSSAADNIASKIGIIRLFNDRGIDVTSETLALPFIGKIGYAQNTRYNFDAILFLNEEILPLTTIAFHGVTPYKMGADGSKAAMLKAIACGASCSIEIEENTDDMTSVKNMARNIYNVSLPMSALSYKKTVGADIGDGQWKIEYEQNSFVEVDFKEQTYTIVSGGKVISKNFTTFMPLQGGKYCYYSIDGGVAGLDLPTDWESAMVTEILPNGEETVWKLKAEKGSFSLEAKADTPYIIERS